MSRNNSDLDKLKLLSANTASNSNTTITSNPVVYDWEDSGMSALDVINQVDKKVQNPISSDLSNIIDQCRITQITPH